MGDYISRIVAPGTGTGPVSLGRMDIDVVATEHGATDLRGLPYDARARRLIAIAPPSHHDVLKQAWQYYSARPQERRNDNTDQGTLHVTHHRVAPHPPNAPSFARDCVGNRRNGHGSGRIRRNH